MEEGSDRDMNNGRKEGRGQGSDPIDPKGQSRPSVPIAKVTPRIGAPLEYRMGVPANPEAIRLVNEYLERAMAREKTLWELGRKLFDEGTLDLEHYTRTGEIRKNFVKQPTPELPKATGRAPPLRRPEQGATRSPRRHRRHPPKNRRKRKPPVWWNDYQQEDYDGGL